MPDPAPLEAWGRETALVRERAAALAAAPSLDEASRRFARVAEACASCHAATVAAKMFFPPPDAPPAAAGARMARHRWAADRLWEGVIGNADEPWRAGLDVLAEVPAVPSPGDGDRTALASALQQSAVRARAQKTTSPAERARFYGELLVTCAACHRGGSTTAR
jgi:cytochrome c553